jgi:hypothetical protein
MLTATLDSQYFFYVNRFRKAEAMPTSPKYLLSLPRSITPDLIEVFAAVVATKLFVVDLVVVGVLLIVGAGIVSSCGIQGFSFGVSADQFVQKGEIIQTGSGIGMIGT